MIISILVTYLLFLTVSFGVWRNSISSYGSVRPMHMHISHIHSVSIFRVYDLILVMLEVMMIILGMSISVYPTFLNWEDQVCMYKYSVLHNYYYVHYAYRISSNLWSLFH